MFFLKIKSNCDFNRRPIMLKCELFNDTAILNLKNRFANEGATAMTKFCSSKKKNKKKTVSVTLTLDLLR